MTPAKSAALRLHAPKGQLPSIPEPEDYARQARLNFIRNSLLNDNWVDKVAAFRRLYGLDKHDHAAPSKLSEARSMLHRRLHAEEFGEAMGFTSAQISLLQEQIGLTPRPSFKEEVDGRLDLIYTLIGELLEMGCGRLGILLLMEEVHCSNMTKTDDNGNPLFDEHGKVLKGANYVKENLGDLLMDLHMFTDEQVATGATQEQETL